MPKPVMPVPAATLILLRPCAGEAPFEVLLMRRTSEASFAPGAYVFPGGRVDEADCAPDVLALCGGVDPAAAFEQMPNADSPEWALGHWVCALREAFEEAGVFLAYGPDGGLHHISATEEDLLHEVRRRVHNNHWQFADVVRNSQLRLAADRLHYYAHWITPKFSPKRFDTRFFVAEVTEELPAVQDGVELVAHEWLGAAEALRRHEVGELPMILPTIVNLRRLADHNSIAAVLADRDGTSNTFME